MEKKYYVYIHIRLDTGAVFYVGKGHGYRARDKCGRNKYWNRVADKSEWIYSIVQDKMYEKDAYLLECWLIAKFRHNGIKLCNLTDGGEGGLGIPSATRKKVFCSNGMEFESGYAAAEWVKLSVSPLARQGHIASCCRGERGRAYGYAWSYKERPVDNSIKQPEATSLSNRKKVYCENGLSFDSCALAAKWLKSNGNLNAISTRISSCANGSSENAYGLCWWYDGGIKSKYIEKHKMIECVGYGVFKTLKSAAEWVSSVSKYKAQGRPIAECANGKYKQAYGYIWRYVE